MNDGLQFQPVTEDLFFQLFLKCSTDVEWPRWLSTKELIHTWCSGWALRTWMDEGQADVIVHNDEVIGYCTLAEVPLTYRPFDDSAFEGGTFLISDARGKGFNAFVKAHLRSVTQNKFKANTLVYIVQQDNLRAQNAMRHLSSSIECVTLEMKDHIWYPYLKRRCFEESSKLLLYVQSFTSL